MRARSLVVLLVSAGACYRPAQEASCTASCSYTADRACPSGLECREDDLCHGPDDPCDPGLVDATPDALHADTGVDTPPQCPATYTVTLLSGSNRYRLAAGPADWLTAAIACAADGPRTHLAVIGSETERSELNATHAGVSTWIGLSDRRTQGAFQWVTAENTGGYPPASGGPWLAGQPDGAAGADCVVMVGNADFDDIACSTQLGYECECDGFPDDPSRY